MKGDIYIAGLHDIRLNYGAEAFVNDEQAYRFEEDLRHLAQRYGLTFWASGFAFWGSGRDMITLIRDVTLTRTDRLQPDPVDTPCAPALEDNL